MRAVAAYNKCPEKSFPSGGILIGFCGDWGAPLTIGIVGLGRFGRAFAGLLEASGEQVVGWDASPVDSDERGALGLRTARTLPELVSQVRFVALAVPLHEMGRAAEAVARSATSEHIVFDVGSLKVEPARALESAFGEKIPWTLTHPLFGPASLARGERPLRVVLCPAAKHPRAAEEVEALFVRAGCEVLTQTPEEHDRSMAWTHALTFFVAKGMLDAGVRTDLPFSPPSFSALATAIETVRGDAGHLFQDLHRRNPFAAEARAALLGALQTIEQGLGAREPSVRPISPSARESILPGENASADLRETRELIDDLDEDIVRLLARRMILAKRAGQEKAKLGRPVVDPEREHALQARRAELAGGMGLPEEDIRNVFDAVIQMARKMQSSTG